jgi:hypothetical protein
MTFLLTEFFPDLLRAGFWVFLLGGFIAVFGKLYIWIDDQWINRKVGGWFGKQQYVFLRIFPPAVNTRSMGEMEQFFNRIWSIYQGRSPFEVYTEGKWYEGYAVEFHSKGGHLGIFIRVNKKHAAIVKSSFEAHFDDVKIAEYPDPLQNWPKDWDRKTGRYTMMYGSDMSILSARDQKTKKGAEAELYQIKSWKDFQTENNQPTSDPAHGLFNALRSLDPEEYLVIQFYIRPYYDDKKIDAWKKRFQDKRIEFTQNVDNTVDAEGNVTLLTESEKAILNSMNRKIHSLNFLCKIRFLAFANEQAKQKKAVALVYSYFVQFDSLSLVFYPDSDAVTSKEAKGEGFGLIGPQLGLFADKAFYEKERYFREKAIYQGLLKRDMDIGSVAYHLTSEELAAMIHFPYVTEDEAKARAMADTSINEEDQESERVPRAVSAVQPPPNLPI